MKITARQYKHAIFALILAVAALQPVPVANASAGSSRTCTLNSTCTVGEFLYDDNYSPITSADCTLTSRYPDGDLLHDSQSMDVSPSDDGWYSYEFTAPDTTGYYRAQVCCSVDGEDLCIDKSFEVSAESEGASANEVASAVWSYSDRTLSGFGNIASDVWNYSGRSLTTFGSLVTDVWNSASRTLTGSQAISLTSVDGDLEDIRKKVTENRLLLEKLVNEPIIQNFIEEDEPDIGKKVTETKTIAGQLYINNEYVASKVSYLVSDWRKLSQDEMLDTLMDINGVMGESTDNGSDNTVFGQLSWLSSNWNWQQISDIKDQTASIKQSLVRSQDILATSGKVQPVYTELKSLAKSFDKADSFIGKSTDAGTGNTLYAKIAETQSIAVVLDERQGEVEKLLTGFKPDEKNFTKSVDQVKKKILAVNKIPRVQTALEARDSEASLDKLLKNKLLGLRAIIIANKRLLAKGSQNPLTNTWLELGSIVFKSLVTNPSTLISQEVPLKYYLPPEVKEEDILEVDSGLTTGYDAEKNQYFVEGKFTLKPGETKTISVRVEDIWVITDENVASLRGQAEELAVTLEKTSFYAQGVTLKTDIDVSLDKILSLQKAAITPEQEIRAYRESAIELNKVNEEMTQLQGLVTQAGSANNFLGFVGGAQTLAVWGLIIIMSAGFVFLALYMKVIAGSKKKQKATPKFDDNVDHKGKIVATNGKHKRESFIKIAFGMIFIAAISAAVSGIVVGRYMRSNSESEVETTGNDTAEIEVNESVMGADDEKASDGSGGEEIVKINAGAQTVEIKSSPKVDSETIAKLSQVVEVTKVRDEGGWVLIAFDSNGIVLEGWVEGNNIITGNSEITDDTHGSVQILDTPTGWLRVRNNPDGGEIAKVNPGETYKLIGVEGEWYQIGLLNDESGWVSKEFAEIIAE